MKIYTNHVFSCCSTPPPLRPKGAVGSSSNADAPRCLSPRQLSPSESLLAQELMQRNPKCCDHISFLAIGQDRRNHITII